MSNLKIKESLIELIKNISGKDFILNNDNFSLTNDLDFDSLLFIQLVVAIESEYSIEFDDDFLMIEKIDKFKDLLAYLESKVC